MSVTNRPLVFGLATTIGLLALNYASASSPTAAMIDDITWSLGPNFPTPVKGGAAGIIGNTLVYVGGERLPDTPTHDSNLTTGFLLGGSSWTSLPNMPTNLTYFDGATVGNSLYITGGRHNFQTQGTTYSLTENNGTWQWNTLPALNVPRGYFGMGATDGKLMIDGGLQGNGQPPYDINSTMNSPELLDTANPQAGWKALPALPGVTRALPTVAGLDGNFYVFGGTIFGYMGGDSTRLSDAYEYHTATNQWTALPDLPYGLSGAAPVVYGDRYIVMLGGVAQGVPNQPGYYNNYVEVFDTLRNTYQVMPTVMPYGTNTMGVAIAGSTIYAIGGESQIAADSNTEPWFQVGQIQVSFQADLNHDGIVNGQDLALVASNWLHTGVGTPGDANGDGVVNAQDIGLIAAQWLQSAGSANGGGTAVPQPASCTMLCIGLACLVPRRRRIADLLSPHFRRTASIALTIALFLALGSTPRTKAEEVGRVALEKQLLVDDQMISEKSGVTREWQIAKKENDGQPVRFWTVDAAGKRIPLKAWIYASPYYDAERDVFRMWSRVYPDGQKMAYGYSESKDGIDFEFKTLLTGLHSLGDYNSVVYLDPHEADPAHRYKIGYDGAREGVVNGATFAHSADGIAWTPYNNGQPVTGRAADFTNHVIWDDRAQAYRLFTRTDFGSAGGPNEIRGMRSMINANFKAEPTAWQKTSEWLLDREGPKEHERRQLYAMTDWTYCGIDFGLFAVYEWPSDFSEGRETDHVKRHERDVMNYYLAVSRDGDHWDLSTIYASRPFVERGAERTWDKDMILPANWIATRGEKHWIYYGGANERHGVAEIAQPQRDLGVGVATLPLDRFVGLKADGERGTITTKTFELSGQNLQVNADCRAGKLWVELLDADGNPLEGFTRKDAVPIAQADLLRAVPRWQDRADCSSLKGRKIRARFHLQNAALFAFEVLEK